LIDIAITISSCSLSLGLVLDCEDVDPINIVSLLFLPQLVEPKPLAFRKVVLPSALVNGVAGRKVNHSTLAFLHAVHVRAVVLCVVFEAVDPFPMFFATPEGTSVLARGFLQDAFVSEKSLLVEFTVVAVDMIVSRLVPPLQLPILSFSIQEGALEDMGFTSFLALSGEGVVPETSLIGVFLAVVGSIKALGYVVRQLAFEIGSISEHEKSKALGFAVPEVAQEKRAIRFVHFAESMGQSNLNSLLSTVLRNPS
jgi:hypothetical protein